MGAGVIWGGQVTHWVTKMTGPGEIVEYGFRVHDTSQVFVAPPPPGLAPVKYIQIGGQLWEQCDNVTLVISGASVMRKVQAPLPG